MKIIKDRINILGDQLNHSNMKYVASPYVMKQKLSTGCSIMYNLLTEELILLDEDEEIPCNYAISNWWVLESTFDPSTLANLVHHMCRRPCSYSYDKYIVLTTSKCNARCYYCYEHNIEKQDMSLDTALQVGRFIENNRTSKVSISWFGGEPLFNRKVIDTITDYLDSRNVPFESTMVSNAYLFDTISDYTLLYKWKLKSVQITIDGGCEEYKKIKNYIDHPEDPLLKVVNNIQRLVNLGISITIRLNVSPYNRQFLQEAFDFLRSHLEDNERIHYYVSQLYYCSEESYSFSEKEISLMYKNMYKLAEDNHKIELKTSTIKDIDTRSYCMMDGHTCTVINTDGSFTPCEHLLSQKDKIGDVYSGIFENTSLSEQENFMPVLDKCKSCPYLPKCFILCGCTPSSQCDKYVQELSGKYIYQYMLEEYSKYKLIDDNEGDI